MCLVNVLYEKLDENFVCNEPYWDLKRKLDENLLSVLSGELQSEIINYTIIL